MSEIEDEVYSTLTLEAAVRQGDPYLFIFQQAVNGFYFGRTGSKKKRFQASLELTLYTMVSRNSHRNPPASASRFLRLKEWSTPPRSQRKFNCRWG